MDKHRALLVEGDAAGDRCPTILQPDDPVFTLKSAGGGRVHRAFLIEGKPHNYSGESLAISDSADAAPTITSSEMKHPKRAFVGKVVSMTPRCLARFQTLPDWYELPEKASLAAVIIGNGVPCRLMQRIAESLN